MKVTMKKLFFYLFILCYLIKSICAQENNNCKTPDAFGLYSDLAQAYTPPTTTGPYHSLVYHDHPCDYLDFNDIKNSN